MDYHIEINKEIIPYTFNISLAKQLYEMRIDYNNTANMFTVALSKDGEVLCSGEPIVYGVPLFDDLSTRDNFPAVVIIPLDESGETDTVTFDNLSNTVLLLTVGENDG